MMFSAFQNLTELVKLAKDDHFQKFFSGPRVQELMKDKEFKREVEQKNLFRLTANPKFTQLLQDPEMRIALEELARKFKRDS